MTAAAVDGNASEILQRLPKPYRRSQAPYDHAPRPSTSDTSLINDKAASSSSTTWKNCTTQGSSLLARMGEVAFAPVENVILRRELKRFMLVLESFDEHMWNVVGELVDETYITSRLFEAIKPVYPSDIRNIAHEIIFRLMINGRYTFPSGYPQQCFSSFNEYETSVHQHILYLSSQYDMHLLYPLFPTTEDRTTLVSRLSDTFFEQYESISQRHDLCNVLDHTRMRIPKWIASDVLKDAARRGDFFTRIILMYIELSRPLRIVPGDGLDLHLKDVAYRLASMKIYDYQLMLLVQSLIQLDISVLRRHLIQHLCSALSLPSSSTHCIEIIVKILCEADWNHPTLETSSLVTLLRQLLTLAPAPLVLTLRQRIISTDFAYRSSLQGASFHHVRQLWVQLPQGWNAQLQVMLNMRSEVWMRGAEEDDRQWLDVWKQTRWYVTQQARSYDDEHNLYDILVILSERRSMEGARPVVVDEVVVGG